MLLEARIYEQGLLEISQLQRRARFRVLCMLVLMVVSETVIQNYGDTLQPINPHTHQCSLRFQDKNSIINKTQTNNKDRHTHIKLCHSAARKGGEVENKKVIILKWWSFARNVKTLVYRSLYHTPVSLSRHYRVWTSLHLPSREYYHLRLNYIITITQNFLLSPHSSTAYYLRVDGSSVYLSWKDFCKNKAPLLIWYSSVLVKLSCNFVRKIGFPWIYPQSFLLVCTWNIIGRSASFI